MFGTDIHYFPLLSFVRLTMRVLLMVSVVGAVLHSLRFTLRRPMLFLLEMVVLFGIVQGIGIGWGKMTLQ